MNKIIASYLFFLIIFTFFSYLFIDPNLTYLHFLYTDFYFSNRLLFTITYILFIIIFYVFYFYILTLSKKGIISLLQLKKLLKFSSIGLIFSYPAMLSFDIFNYIITAKTIFFYRENPYIVMPIEFLNEPFLSFTRAANKIALYGFSWIILSGVPYVLGFHNFLLILFNFKIFIILFYILTLVVFYKISKNIYSFTLFALNPLVLIETLVSSHNDIVMMFFALSSFYLLKKNKLFFAFLSLLISIFIKYATLFLLPWFLLVVFLKLRKKVIPWENIFKFSSFSMLLAFLLSPLREEIYPWYFIWFLSFFLIYPIKKITLLVIFFSFGLLLRYVPFMYLGTYFGPTPLIKMFVTFVIPLIMYSFWLLSKKFRV